MLVKKIYTILLLGILACGMFGYKFFMQYALQKENNKILTQIENKHYDETNLVEVVVPLSMPYYTYTTNGYERYDGEITHKGVTYTYVERKIADGKLYIKCLSTCSKQQIKNSITEYFAGVNNIDSEKNNSHPSKKIITKQGIDEFEELNTTSLHTLKSITVSIKLFSLKANVPTLFLSVSEQPPKLI